MPRSSGAASSGRSRPATTPEGRESQLVALAIDRAEQQIRDGTASAQVLTHFLKLGSSRERLEQDRLEQDNKLMKAKIDQLASQANMEELYGAALNAMTAYSGKEVEPQDAIPDGYYE